MHASGYRKLGKATPQRKALLRNQVTNLLYHGKIKTTETRAKEVRRIAEKLITIAVKEKDNFEEVEVTAKVAKKDGNGKRVKEVVNGKKVTESTTLEQLGFKGDSNGEGKFRVKVGNATTDITVTKDMKISDVVKKLQSAGVNASFDAKNQRFYVNAKNSGANADFTITSNDAGGQEALSTLKLMAAYDPNSNEYKEYQKWAGYATAGRADADGSGRMRSMRRRRSVRQPGKRARTLF